MTTTLGGSSDERTLVALWDAGYEWICLDMFDTLVTRRVHPEDVKRLACERLARVAVPGMDGRSLYLLRAETERRLCEDNRAAGFDLEFDLEACLVSLASTITSLDRDARQDFVQKGLAIELAVECSVQELDAEVAAFVRSRPPHGPRLALVSDFYLHGSELRRLLRYHGLDGEFETVFSSADDLLSKRSGRRYPALIDALGCLPERVVMVGDNPAADIEQARSHGLATHHLDRSTRHQAYAGMARDASDLSRTGRSIDAILRADREAIFPELALTLYCFIERLYETLQSARVEDVLFLSREGQPLKTLFDAYQRQRDPADSLLIRSHYLEASRRSLFLPSLDPLEDEDFHRLFRQYRRISWGEFLRSLGLDELIDEMQPIVGTDAATRLDDLPTSAEFRKIVDAPVFRDHYEDGRVARRRAFMSYLGAVRGPSATGAMTIVDVGWKGTMQDNLVRLLVAAAGDDAPPVHGLYVGLVATGATRPRSTKHGLLFSAVGKATPWFRVFDENRSLFEVALAADHASTAAYGFDIEGRGIPIRGEFSEESMIREMILPLLDTVVETFQRVDELLMSRRYSPSWLLKQTARHHARMVFAASSREIEWFTHLHHVENFGLFEKSSFGYQAATDPLERARFAASLLRRQGREHLGFWPWLRCVQQGGRPLGFAYGTARRLQASITR